MLPTSVTFSSLRVGKGAANKLMYSDYGIEDLVWPVKVKM